MKLGILNKDHSFILRWDFNRNSLFQSPVVAGLGDSWLSGIGTDSNDKLYSRIKGWLNANTSNSGYINFTERGWSTGELTPDFLTDTYEGQNSEPASNVSRACKRGANILFVWLGSNDFVVWGNSKETWISNLQAMKQEADKYGAEIFFTTPRASDDWSTPQSRSDVQWVANQVRILFPNNYFEYLDNSLKTVKGDNDIAFDYALYGSELSAEHHPNAAATSLLFDMWRNKMVSYFTDKNIYSNYLIEKSIDGGTVWTTFQSVPASTVFLELPYANNDGKYRVKAQKIDTSFTTYSGVVETVQPDTVMWSMTTAITPLSAKIGGRILYKPRVQITVKEPKVYSLVFDKLTFKMYVNGELISSVANPGNCKFLGNIFLGADYDDTQHFKGVLPNLTFWNKALNNTDRVAFENWMADKWLPTGNVLSGGHIVLANPGLKPGITTVGAASFIDLDETGLELSRTNLLLRSEEFNQTSWTKTGVTTITNSIAGPLGSTLNAEKVVEASGGTNHYIGQAINIVSGTDYTLSVYAKAGERSVLVMSPTETGSSNYITRFNLFSGVIISSDANNISSINDAGNGWYRCSIRRRTANTQTSVTCRIGLNDGVATSFSYSGNGTSGLYLFGAQLEKGGLTSCIPTTTVPVTVAETRIKNWKDSTTFGTQRTASPKTGTDIGIRVIKGKNSAYFDNPTFLKIPILDTTENSPDPITIMWVAEFDNFDEPYSGQTDQTVWGANGNSAVRIKKFGSDQYLGARFGTNASGFTTIAIPKNKVLVMDDPASSIVGNVRIKYSNQEDLSNYLTTDTLSLTHGTFGAFHFDLMGLDPDTKYYGIVEVDGTDEPSSKLEFKTFKLGTHSFKLLIGSCNKSASLARTWDQMLTENADMMFHLGDLNYENVDSGNIQDYIDANKLTFDSPKIKDFFRKQATMYIPDNHDSLNPSPIRTNANWPVWKQFQMSVLPNYSSEAVDEVATGLYFSFNLGRMNLIVLDTRRNRDNAGNTDDATKTMLGPEQKQWLKDKLLSTSNDPYLEQTIIFSSVLYLAVVGDPTGDSYDSAGPSWGSYATERAELANFIYDNGIKNVVWACTDSHLQAIDDGRNAVYATDSNGVRIDWRTMSPEFLTPVLEASPIERYVELQGGPFQISDVENSGGPFQEYYSYGIIEITDRGEDWIQTRFSIKAYRRSDNTWPVIVSYAFNRPARGIPGTPPPVTDDETLALNGYIGENDEWKRILQRYISVNNEYKPVQHKFVGKGGLWRLVYSDIVSKQTDGIFITHANAYTVNHNNVVYLYGKDLFSSKFPKPKIGGFWSFENRLTDSFDNFTILKQIGSGIEYDSLDGLTGGKITNTTSWIESDPAAAGGLNSASFGGYKGDKNFFAGIHFALESGVMKSNGLPIWIWFSGASFNGKRIGLCVVPTGTDTGTLQFVMSDAISTMTWVAPSVVVVPNVWHRFGVNWFAFDPLPVTKFYLRTGVDSTYPEVLDFQKFDLNVTPLSWVGDIGDKIYVGAGINSGNTVVSKPGLRFRNFHIRGALLSELNVVKALSDPKIGVILYDQNDKVITQLAGPEQRKEYLLRFLDNSISFLTPKNFDGKTGYIRVVNGNFRSVKLPFRIVPVTKRAIPLRIDFTDLNFIPDTLNIRQAAWGGANGGVVADNVRIENGELVLIAHGDLFSGDVQGVDRDGNSKFHTHPNDPRVGLPWIKRVGAVVQTKENYGYGSYRVLAKLPMLVGACSAIWTFHYEEAYPGSPLYTEIEADGLSPMGNDLDGNYIVRNHEIDIEFPSHIEPNPFNQPDYTNAKMNTWLSEIESEINLTPLGQNVADGQYHEIRFDWHYNRVEFYIDGILKKTNITNVPNIPGPFVVGIWFPSSNRNSVNHPSWYIDAPWLPNPDLTWAGTANWDKQELRVKNISFTPFNEPGERLIGETYPFGNLRNFTDDVRLPILDDEPDPVLPSVQFYSNTSTELVSGTVRIYDDSDVLIDTQTFSASTINTKTIKQPPVWRMEIDVTSTEAVNKTTEIYIGGVYIDFYRVFAGETRTALKIPYPSGTHSLIGNITLSFY
jgi:hypothetical protein